MGMAASQARYLALVARKSNCEYEGQQINQARTALSNQSANLFNQMLGLQVPIPPSTQDFTKTQYSYTDGFNASTIDSWEQLATPEEDYNYVVTHHYYTDVYKGSQKLLNDPQVQFNSSSDYSTIAEARSKVASAERELIFAETSVQSTKNIYDTAVKILNKLTADAATLANYSTEQTGIKKIEAEVDASGDATGAYIITASDDSTATYTPHSNLNDTTTPTIVEANNLVGNFNSVGVVLNTNELLFGPDGKFIYISDAESMLTDYDNLATGEVFDGNLNVYSYNDDFKTAIGDQEAVVTTAKTNYDSATNNYKEKETAYNDAVVEYEELAHPSYIGNCELTPIASLSEDQEAAIKQIVVDMNEQGITSDIVNYYDPVSGTYSGGLYSFKLNGVTYYTTYTDLESSYLSGTGINNIDGQSKMAYYNATYVETKVEKTEKALLETDGNGRFTSIRFADDSMTYTLNMETITDEAAYKDAMNQYNYENAKYDKMVQDINAKTSIIQREDQQLELRLKQLDTEQSALSAEMDAVKKVVDDNVEKSFKTFGG